MPALCGVQVNSREERRALSALHRCVCSHTCTRVCVCAWVPNRLHGGQKWTHWDIKRSPKVDDEEQGTGGGCPSTFAQTAAALPGQGARGGPTVGTLPSAPPWAQLPSVPAVGQDTSPWAWSTKKGVFLWSLRILDPGSIRTWGAQPWSSRGGVNIPKPLQSVGVKLWGRLKAKRALFDKQWPKQLEKQSCREGGG